MIGGYIRGSLIMTRLVMVVGYSYIYYTDRENQFSGVTSQ
jgi:hypothetical protein